MPVMDGIAATQTIRAADNAPAVLIMTTFDLDEYVLGEIRAGAAGFLLKDQARSNSLTQSEPWQTATHSWPASHRSSACRDRMAFESTVESSSDT
jgi:DNA-binding NarL/FixJ family response regulator